MDPGGSAGETRAPSAGERSSRGGAHSLGGADSAGAGPRDPRRHARECAEAPAARGRCESLPSELVRRFAEQVRRATPETSGFLEPDAAPEYGLLVPPTLGHSFVYNARRPVPANNFGPYLDAEKYDRATAFYHVSTEAEAAAIAKELGARYVVTQLQGVAGESLGAFVAQLHDPRRRCRGWPPRPRALPARHRVTGC